MSVDRFAEVLRARWKLVALVWAGVVGLVAVGSFVVTPHYAGTAVVMVEPKAPDPVVGLSVPNALMNHIPTEIDVVQSERVARTALHALGLQSDPLMLERWKQKTGGRGDFEAWLAADLLANLDVRPSRESNVLTISFTAPEPSMAAKVANAFTDAYIQNSADLRLEPARQFNTYFDESGKRLRENLEQAQHKLAAYLQKNGLVGADDKLDVEALRLSELGSNLVRLQSSAAQAAERQRQARLDPAAADDIQRNPAVAALTAELLRQEGRLAELRSRYGEQHPTVAELRESTADLRTRIGAAAGRASRSLGAESRVATDLVAQAQRAVDEQRARIVSAKAIRDGAQVLQREVDNAQRAYDMVLTRTTQTAIEAGAVRSNVSVLKRATPSARPRTPRLGLNIAAASIIGVLLAFGAAFWREGRDRRLLIAGDVTEFLGQPLLVVVPYSPFRSQPLLTNG